MKSLNCKIDTATDAARKEHGLLLSALEQLKSLAVAEQEEVLAKVERERQAKAAVTAKTIMDTNSAIDSKLGELHALLACRANHLHSLRGLAVCDGMYINRMVGRDL